jgi:hypothetical protein
VVASGLSPGRGSGVLVGGARGAADGARRAAHRCGVRAMTRLEGAEKRMRRAAWRVAYWGAKAATNANREKYRRAQSKLDAAAVVHARYLVRFYMGAR